MPLKEIKDPPKKDGERKQRKAESTAPTTDTDPWKVLDDGSRVRQGKRLPFEKKLHKVFLEVAGAVTLADSFSGEAIKRQAAELAYGYASLAQENEAVKAFFARALTVSAYSAVVGPTAAVIIPILWHFGLIPARIGVPVTIMSGGFPFTREQEQEYKRDQQREQEAAARAAQATHPHGDGNGDGDKPD